MSFTLRPATADDYERIVQIVNSQVPEPTTVESIKRNDGLRPPELPFTRLVATTPDGQIAGLSTCGQHPGNKPGHFFTSVRVDKPYQGQGLGGKLYAALEEWAISHGATRLEGGVREDDPSSVAWAQRRGAVTDHHLYESTLSLPEFDPTPFLGAVEQAKASGIRFTSLAEEGADDETIQFVIEDPLFDPHGVILAADGDRWVALAHMMRRSSGGLYNGFTGVDRDYRGRGLSLAVKIVGLLWAKSTGAPYIRTHNHSVNQRMLSTNRRLGYVPEMGIFHLIKHIDR